MSLKTPVEELVSLATRYRADGKRVRRLADQISHPEATKALRAYADELDAHAVEMEANVAALRRTLSETSTIKAQTESEIAKAESSIAITMRRHSTRPGRR